MEKQKRLKKQWFIIAVALILVVGIGVIWGVKMRRDKKAEEMAITAMYISFGDEGYVFVSEQAGVFTVTFPEEIYDSRGERITREQLVKGNVVKIYGDGIMLESYPGQYPGVTKMVVTETGTPADADIYQQIVDELYCEPDPAEPPTLNAEYTTELMSVTVMVNRGGYEWTYTDKDGLSNAVIADSAHVLQWKEVEELVDIKLADPVDLTLHFSKVPQEVQVVRYDSSLLGTQEIPDGELVKVEQRDGKVVIPEVIGGYVYELTGIWENGRAQYGFYTIVL